MPLDYKKLENNFVNYSRLTLVISLLLIIFGITAGFGLLKESKFITGVWDELIVAGGALIILAIADILIYSAFLMSKKIKENYKLRYYLKSAIFIILIFAITTVILVSAAQVKEKERIHKWITEKTPVPGIIIDINCNLDTCTAYLINTEGNANYELIIDNDEENKMPVVIEKVAIDYNGFIFDKPATDGNHTAYILTESNGITVKSIIYKWQS